MVLLMNELYKEVHNPLKNYFNTSMKLKSKTRIGGRIKKEYDRPQTPCDRLLAHEGVSEEIKERLRETRSKLNPFVLARKQEKLLCKIFKLKRRSSQTTSSLRASLATTK